MIGGERLLDISKLIANKDTGLLEFSSELDLSGAKLWNDKPFPYPVKVWGTIREDNVEEKEYIVEYQVDYTSVLPCARCLTVVKKERSERFTHILRDTGEDPTEGDSYSPISGGKLDLEQMVLSDMLLHAEEVPLCKPDCLGICPICGKDQNEEPCDCEPEYRDPRFDVLRELLDKNKQQD